MFAYLSCFEQFATDGRVFEPNYIVMEYLNGTLLSNFWSSISTAHRNVVVDKIADIAKELRRLRIDHIGPIGGGKSEGPWFSDYDAGPFLTLGDLEQWNTYELNVMKKV